jgi:membrane fusion protein, heavy metal efflux system
MIQLRMYFIIVPVTVVSLFFTGCSSKENKSEEARGKEPRVERITLTKQAINDIGLKVEQVSYQSTTSILTIPAQVLTNQDMEAQVGTPVPGRISKVLVNLGDHVQCGQELMLIEGVEIGEMISLYLKAKAQLVYADAALERQQSLVAQNVGSQKALLEAQAEHEKAHAEFTAEDKRIHSIGLTETDIERLAVPTANGPRESHIGGILPVKSPIDGVVVERNVVIGQLVDGAANAFRIINTSSVWIDGHIYENDLNKVTKKTNVVFSTASYPNEKFRGNMMYIGQVIDEKSRTIIVRAEFLNAHGKLKPHMFGEMHIPTGKNATGILIPAESVVKINNADNVFVQKDDSSFERRFIIIRSTQKEVVEIQEGLAEKELIVIKGAFYLKSELMKAELGEGE